jgi:hypothetical protein
MQANGGKTDPSRTMVLLMNDSLQCLEVKMQAKDFSFHSIAFYRGISGSLVALTWAIIK